jgi:hypothetical protein
MAAAVWPLIEGRKGVSAAPHASSGAGGGSGIGTVSAVNADSYDPKGGSFPNLRGPDAARAT